MYEIRKCECGADVVARRSSDEGAVLCVMCMRSSRKARRPMMNRARGIWRGMIDRCSNPRCTSWKYYGGRGITVSKRWASFEKFVEDMGLPAPGMSIERINVNRGYTRKNCKWIPRELQNRNKRNTKLSPHTAAVVGEIVRSGVVAREVAVEYGISDSHARKVAKGRYWKGAECT